MTTKKKKKSISEKGHNKPQILFLYISHLQRALHIVREIRGGRKKKNRRKVGDIKMKK